MSSENLYSLFLLFIVHGQKTIPVKTRRHLVHTNTIIHFNFNINLQVNSKTPSQCFTGDSFYNSHHHHYHHQHHNHLDLFT